MKKLNVIISILFLFLNTEFSFPQSDPDQICGSEFNYGGEDIDSLFGGRFKPHRTDIGGSPENEGKFPVLIVFVQFQGEPCSGDTLDYNCWPCNQPPKYKDSLISEQRLSSSNWWDDFAPLLVFQKVCLLISKI